MYSTHQIAFHLKGYLLNKELKFPIPASGNFFNPAQNLKKNCAQNYAREFFLDFAIIVGEFVKSLSVQEAI